MKLAFLGDLAFLGKYDIEKFDQESIEEKLFWLKDKLEEYDYIIANLETPLTNKKTSLYPKGVHLRSSEENIKILKYLNISAVSLANNHIFDMGKKGLNDTIKVLDKANIKWFGIDGKSLHENIDNNKLAISGYCCLSTNGLQLGRSVNLLNKDLVKNKMLKDKEAGELSILSIHWGLEHTSYPSYTQTNIAKLISGYNDCIIHGHHAHVIQGINKLNSNSYVMYSLGNCIFDSIDSKKGNLHLPVNSSNQESLIACYEIENNIIKSFDTIGFQFKNGFYVAFDNKPVIDEISNRIVNVNESDYKEIEEMRKNEFNKVILDKFGKRDYNWLKKRMNYNSIGNLVLSKFRTKRLNKEMKNFHE